jgi:hypothetical protein
MWASVTPRRRTRWTIPPTAGTVRTAETMKTSAATRIASLCEAAIA